MEQFCPWRLWTIVLSFLLIQHRHDYIILGKKFIPCPSNSTIEQRKLFVATCDTRSGWKEFNAMKIWNVTGIELRKQGLSMKNVCKGQNWGKHGFLTKPLIYLEYLKQIMNHHENNEIPLIHVILMDSDTYWAANEINQLWTSYDCARNNKPVIVATEMSCWVGRYCTRDDLHRWYNHTQLTPSYSPFVNSGVIMGQITHVVKMLEYVIKHNQTYFLTVGKKFKFDDQYAIADYAINVHPDEVALDYHEQFSASCSIHAPGDPPEDGWPFVCKMRNGELSPSCPNYTNLMSKLGHFTLNDTSCLSYRVITSNMKIVEELESMSLHPCIYHGNGAGKRIFLSTGYRSYKCYLAKMNSTELEHSNSYSE